MNTALYYFTGTGNSLETARLIGQKLGSTQLFSIASLQKETVVVCAAERIGIIFPVYLFGLPLIVRNFAQKLRAVKTAVYIFSVATYGGNIGAANLQLQKILRQNGLVLQGGFGLKMPGNYLPLYGAPAHKTLVKMIAQAGAQTSRLAERILHQEKALARSNFFIRPLGQWFYNKNMPTLPAADKNFQVKDSCTSCGICARLCPAGNIYLQNGRPNWLHRCEQCLACLQWCPAEAVQYGKKTASRRRYHHPAINVLDIEKSR
ncbi:MAG: EFR1 family ferrodoxin [Candidatus Margulisbacteria bacterium]|jgi:ferredoxin|nr:EFR1 family ferrodoxin [Candidatus Margulisiibacteriota bacterium]